MRGKRLLTPIQEGGIRVMHVTRIKWLTCCTFRIGKAISETTPLGATASGATTLGTTTLGVTPLGPGPFGALGVGDTSSKGRLRSGTCLALG